MCVRTVHKREPVERPSYGGTKPRRNFVSLKRFISRISSKWAATANLVKRGSCHSLGESSTRANSESTVNAPDTIIPESYDRDDACPKETFSLTCLELVCGYHKDASTPTCMNSTASLIALAKTLY